MKRIAMMVGSVFLGLAAQGGYVGGVSAGMVEAVVAAATNALGTAAYSNSSAFASAAQGLLADSAVKPTDISAFARNVYFVDAANGSDANDGGQWAPWQTIACAQTNAVAGSTIYVAPGTYAGTMTNGAVAWQFAKGATAAIGAMPGGAGGINVLGAGTLSITNNGLWAVPAGQNVHIEADAVDWIQGGWTNSGMTIYVDCRVFTGNMVMSGIGSYQTNTLVRINCERFNAAAAINPCVFRNGTTYVNCEEVIHSGTYKLAFWAGGGGIFAGPVYISTDRYVFTGDVGNLTGTTPVFLRAGLIYSIGVTNEVSTGNVTTWLDSNVITNNTTFTGTSVGTLTPINSTTSMIIQSGW